MEGNKRAFHEIVERIRNLPYGRNSDRANYRLVEKEGRGTCSTKHAYLKSVAAKNGIDRVELILAIYKMDGQNTPDIGDVLDRYNLNYIPEAHCYLSIDGERLDITKADSDISTLLDYIVEEQVIVPDQIGEYKLDYHKNYLRKWIENSDIDYSFEEIWKIREECILALSLTKI